MIRTLLGEIRPYISSPQRDSTDKEWEYLPNLIRARYD